MGEPLPPPHLGVLALARSDRAAATRALADLSVDQQVTAVCGAPLARRAELLELLPRPEEVVPLLPEAELCFTVKAIGVHDAGWLLDLASPEQVVACLDLDVWTGTELDRSSLEQWSAGLAELSDDAFLRALLGLDPELLALLLKSRLYACLKPDGDDGWQVPDGTQTLDNQFYFAACVEGDDLADIQRLLRTLFVNQYWLYFRMMQAIIWEPDLETEEWALRWRTGRLQDLGFPAWDEAMGIYRFVPAHERAALSDGSPLLDQGEWQLPVFLPGLPAGAGAKHAVFRAIADLGEDERRGAFYALVSVANKVAVADRMPLGDAESTPRAIEKVARLASDGLEWIARERGLPLTEVIRRVSIERLFRVGANLDPERARR